MCNVKEVTHSHKPTVNYQHICSSSPAPQGLLAWRSTATTFCSHRPRFQLQQAAVLSENAVLPGMRWGVDVNVTIFRVFSGVGCVRLAHGLEQAATTTA